MSKSVNIRLKGHVTSEEILNFVKQKVDPAAVSLVKRLIYRSTGRFSESGSIVLNSNNEPMAMYYFYMSKNLKGNDDYWDAKGMEKMTEEYTSLNMDSGEKQIKILREIVHQYGGWIDEDDSDDFEPVVKNQDGTIKPVFHVSMEDIYEKFGGVVIIDKK